MAGSVFRKVMLIIILILVLIIFFQPVIVFSKLGYDAPDGSASHVLDADYVVCRDGVPIKDSLPFRSLFFSPGRYSISFTLGSLSSHDALAFQTKGCGIRVLIDGREVYSYAYPEYYSYPAVRMYHSVPLSSSYSGSGVIVEYLKGNGNPAVLEIAYPVLGSTSSNYHYFFDPYKWPSVLLVAMISFGVMLLVLSFMVKGKRRFMLLIFSLLVLDITLTIFFESLLAELVFSNPLLSSKIACFLRTLTCLLCFLLLRVNFPQSRAFSFNSILFSLSLSCVLLFPLFSLLSFMGAADFNMIYFLQQSCAILFLAIATTEVSRFRSSRRIKFVAFLTLFLMKNIISIILSSSITFGAEEDVINILISSAAFLILTLDALRSYAEENEMIVNLNTFIRKSHIDSLSGLENLNAFTPFLEDLKKNGEVWFMMFFDIDGLKSVNDSMGHLKGDELIRDFGEAVRGVSQDSLYPFRLGGDEFIIFFKDVQAGFAILSDITKSYESMSPHYGVSGAGGVIDFQKDDFMEVFKGLDRSVMDIKRAKNEGK